MKGCFATFLAILAGILTLLVITALGLRFTLFDLQFLKAQLIKNDIYEFLSDDVVPALVDESINSMNACGTEETTNGTASETCPVGTETESGIPITEEDIANIAATVITEDMLQETVETAINDLDSFLKSEGDNPEIMIDFSEYKSILVTEIINLLEDKYYALPYCTSAQLHEQSTNPDQAFPECRPQNISFDEYTSAATEGEDFRQALTDGISESIPDEIDLLNPVLPGSTTDKSATDMSPTKQGFLEFRDWYTRITQGIFIAVAVDAALLLLLLVLYITNLRAGFRWVGIPLTISGGLALLTGLAGKFASNLAIQELERISAEGTTSAAVTTGAATAESSLPTFITDKLISLVTSILSAVNARILIYAVLVFGAGVLFIILSFVFKKKVKGPVPPVNPQPGAVQPVPVAPQPAPVAPVVVKPTTPTPPASQPVVAQQPITPVQPPKSKG